MLGCAEDQLVSPLSFLTVSNVYIPDYKGNMQTELQDKGYWYLCVVLFKEGFTAVWSQIF